MFAVSKERGMRALYLFSFLHSFARGGGSCITRIARVLDESYHVVSLD